MSQSYTIQEIPSTQISEEKHEFHSLAENVHDPIYRYDSHCRRIYVNPAVEKLCGKEASTLLGKTPTESLLVTPDDSSNVLKSLQHVIATGQVDTVEVTFEKEDGSYRYYQHLHVPEFSHDGTVESVLAIGRDISAHKNLQQELLSREHMFRTLAENSPNIIMRYDKECQRVYVNPAYAEQTGIPIEKALHATPNAQWKMYLNMLTISAEAYQKKVLHVIQTGESTQLIVEWERYSDHQRVSHDLHIVPEKDLHGNITGALAIGHNITTYREQKTILKTKELEFRTLAENSPDAIVRYDRNLKRTYVNATWERANNILRSEILGKSPTEQTGRITDRVDEFEAMLRRVLNTGESEKFEVEWKNKEKKVFFFSFHSVAEYDGAGNIISVLTISRDISTQKELQNALSSQEQLFRALAENSPDSIIRYDTACRRTYVNPIVERVFGVPSTELLGKSPSETALLPESILHENALKKVLNSAQEFSLEVQFSLPNGQQIWGDIRLIPEFNKEGKVVSVLSVGRDITERKNLEIHLNATLSQFEQFINNIPEMAWIKDKNSHYVIVNQVFANRFEVSAKDMIGKNDFDFFDEKTSRAHIEVDLKVMREGNTCNVEEMISSNPDNEIWIESIKNPFRDSDGEIIGTIGAARDITERKHIEKQMAFMAQHDTLTDLPNRALAKDRAEQAIAHAKRNESKVAFLFIDLDKFKDINDSLGHLAGDTILQLVASQLGLCIRETDTLSRQGGDEFLIMLSDIHNSNDVLLTIDKIFKILEEPFRVGSHTLFTSVSIGVSLYPDDGATFNKLYQRADIAMYQAKELGRNTYAFHSSTISSTMIEQLKLQNDLRVAVKNSEFILHYQPQIDLSNQHITGVEALIRWIHPERGLIAPLTFIPLAESSGLIVEIGEWVLIEACKQAALWHQKQLFINIAVNISAIQFKRGNLIAVVQKALDISGLDPRFLELELTESIFIHNTQETLKMIQNLKEIGIMLSIDDFGTGYSSLTYLKRFKVDKLKIDRSFIQNLLQDQEDAVIVKTIIQMAKSLNLKTIAEGVEDKAVLDTIYNYGCDEVQGYYFAKPMEAQYIDSRIDTTMKWVR